MAEINKDWLKDKVDRQARIVLGQIDKADLYGTLVAGIRFNELQIERKNELSNLYSECIKLEYLIRKYKDASHLDISRYSSLEEKIGNISDRLLEHISQLE